MKILVHIQLIQGGDNMPKKNPAKDTLGVRLGLESNEIDLIDEKNIYFYLLTNLALTRYKWKNLPSEIDERFLELTLMRNGRAVFFFDESFGYMCLPFTDRGQLNYYHYPSVVEPYAVGEYKFKPLELNDCVLIYNDVMHSTPYITLLEYSQQMINISTTLKVNTRKLRNPMIALCDESQKLTYQKILNEIQTGEIALLGNKTIDIDDFKTLPTTTDVEVKALSELRAYKKDVWYEALSYLGIRNMNTGKTERAIVDEVNAENEETDIFKNSGLFTRQQACKHINEKYGLNVSVRYTTLQPVSGEERTGADRNEPEEGEYNE